MGHYSSELSHRDATTDGHATYFCHVSLTVKRPLKQCDSVEYGRLGVWSDCRILDERHIEHRPAHDVYIRTMEVASDMLAVTTLNLLYYRFYDNWLSYSRLRRRIMSSDLRVNCIRTTDKIELKNLMFTVESDN